MAEQQQLDTRLIIAAQEATAAALTSIMERSRADARIQKLQAALQILVALTAGAGQDYRVTDILLSPSDEAARPGISVSMLHKYMHIIRAAIAGKGAPYECERDCGASSAYSASPSDVAQVLMRLTGLQARFQEDLTSSRTNSRTSRWLVYLD